MRRGDSRGDSESVECNRYDSIKQFHRILWGGRGGGDGNRAENQYGADEHCHGLFTGHYAVSQLQLCERQWQAHEADGLFCPESDYCLFKRYDAWILSGSGRAYQNVYEK